MEPSIECKPDKEMPNQWRLALTLYLGSASADKPFLYEGEVQVLGLVEVAESFPAEKRENFARVNGIGLLYSAIREMLLNLSARSARGRLCLPVLNFAEFFASETKSKTREPKTPRAPKAKTA